MGIGQLKRQGTAGHWWLILGILATWKAEIGRIIVQDQPGQKV
jgi:hypothetical protein